MSGGSCGCPKLSNENTCALPRVVRVIVVCVLVRVLRGKDACTVDRVVTGLWECSRDWGKTGGCVLLGMDA